MDLTTGSGLRPPPAAIIVMTPTGSGNQHGQGQLDRGHPADQWMRNIKTGLTGLLTMKILKNRKKF
ncbi:MAG: hypothetical protein DRP56_10775 [Planctomycetota bacterium]|nr:MAG: hypothetical protein DRP56_10775 [Planctomycetota bacterium]